MQFQDNRTIVARRDGASPPLPPAQTTLRCTGNYTKRGRRDQNCRPSPDVPLHFKAVSVHASAGTRRAASSATNGILYQISGSTEVALDGAARMLNAGEGAIHRRRKGPRR